MEFRKSDANMMRTAWELSKATYDTEFQQFMDRKIAAVVPGSPPVASPVAPAPHGPEALVAVAGHTSN